MIGRSDQDVNKSISTSKMAVSGAVSIPESDLSWKFGPSGGPGGQHANTTNSRAELVWEIGPSSVDPHQKKRLLAKLGPRVRVVVDETRSQARNRSLALKKLDSIIAAALVEPKKRKKTKRSRGANERRLKAKRQRSQRKADRRGQFD